MSSIPTLFSNFGKSVKDFFDADGKKNSFNSGRHSVVVRNGAANGITLTHSQHVTGANVEHELKLNYKNSKFGSAEASGTVAGVKGKVKLNKIHPGLEVELSGEDGKKQKAEATVNYVKDMIAASIKANLNKLHDVEASVAVGVDNISVGAKVNVGDVAGEDKKANTGVTDYNGAFQYEQKDLTVTVATENKLDAVNLSVKHIVNGDVTVNGSASYAFSTKAAKISAGAAVALDSATSLKAKLSHEGAAAVNFEHLFKSYAKLNVASTFNLASGSPAPAFGVSLTLGQTSE